MVDNVYKGSTLTLTIKDTLVKESTWFDTTQVTINFDDTLAEGALNCPTQAYLKALGSDPVLKISAI